jgi:hypothetical protein
MAVVKRRRIYCVETRNVIERGLAESRSESKSEAAKWVMASTRYWRVMRPTSFWSPLSPTLKGTALVPMYQIRQIIAHRRVACRRYLDGRIANPKQIDVLANQDAHCRRLVISLGVGPIIASTMVAAIGTGDALKGQAWAFAKSKQTSIGDPDDSRRHIETGQ